MLLLDVNVSIGTIVTVITLLVMIGGIVWGGGRLEGKVNRNAQDIEAIKKKEAKEQELKEMELKERNENAIKLEVRLAGIEAILERLAEKLK